MRSLWAWGLLLVATQVASCSSTNSAAAVDCDLVVMSWNIHHGRGLDGRVDLERIAALIRAANADVVALQEVDRGVSRTQGRDLAAELGELCGMTAVFGKNTDYQGGDYGNAILSRLPIEWSANHHYQMLRPGEQRGLLRVRVRVGERVCEIWNTHIDYRPDDSERLANVGEMVALLGAAGDLPVVLCGDFNDTPGSRTHTALTQAFTDGWGARGVGRGLTFSSDRPRKRIDYVWIRPDAGPEVLETRVLVSRASDHLPLVACCRLGPPAGPAAESK